MCRIISPVSEIYPAMKQGQLFCTDCKTNLQWTEEPPTLPGAYWTIYPSAGATPTMTCVAWTARLINHDKPKSEQYWKTELIVRDWNGKDVPVEHVAGLKRGPWGGVLWSERLEEPEIPPMVMERRASAEYYYD